MGLKTSISVCLWPLGEHSGRVDQSQDTRLPPSLRDKSSFKEPGISLLLVWAEEKRQIARSTEDPLNSLSSPAVMCPLLGPAAPWNLCSGKNWHGPTSAQGDKKEMQSPGYCFSVPPSVFYLWASVLGTQRPCHRCDYHMRSSRKFGMTRCLYCGWLKK